MRKPKVHIFPSLPSMLRTMDEEGLFIPLEPQPPPEVVRASYVGCSTCKKQIGGFSFKNGDGIFAKEVFFQKPKITDGDYLWGGELSPTLMIKLTAISLDKIDKVWFWHYDFQRMGASVV